MDEYDEDDDEHQWEEYQREEKYRDTQYNIHDATLKDPHADLHAEHDLHVDILNCQITFTYIVWRVRCTMT